MTSDGHWDLYGNFNGAFDDFTFITEGEVQRIIEKRQRKLDEKKARDLKKLEEKMKRELELRFKEREILSHEVDTTSIDEMFAIYSELGGLSQEKMQKELQNDFAQLEAIIGELNYEEMAVLK